MRWRECDMAVVSIELNEQQRAAVEGALSKQVSVIKGSAGSGKTLVAIAIAQRLCENWGLFSASEDDRVTVVTYTNSLVSYITTQIPEGFSAKTYTVHAYLTNFLEANGIRVRPIKPDEFLKTRVSHDSKLSIEFLKEEFKWILGRGLKDKKDYLGAKRVGRKQALREADRTYVFDLLDGYLKDASLRNRIDFDDIGNQVLELCSKGDAKKISTDLVIDEVQDLSATILKALPNTVEGKVVYIGDVAQSIYGSGFTWKDSIGRTSTPFELNSNYRNTRQIYDAADSILKFEYELDDKVAGETSQKQAVALLDGDRPQLFFCNSDEDEAYNVQMKVSQLLKTTEPSESICIGYRRIDEASGRMIEYIKKKLNDKNVAYCDPKRRKDGLNLSARVVFLTFHSMKGLEFDHVLLIDLEDYLCSDEQEETERRLLFVAMTRAKKTLSLFSGSDDPLRFLGEVSSSKVLPVVWNQSSYEKTYRAQIDKVDESRGLLRRQHAEENARIALLEEEKLGLEDGEESSKQGEGSILSAKDERIIALGYELERALKRQKELESKLKYFNSEREKALSHFYANENELGVAKYCFREDARILILGGEGMKDKEIRGILKELGLPADAYRLIRYEDVTNFDISKYQNTIEYSDIFVSVVPHKVKGTGKSSSLLQFLKDNSISYPKLSVFENPDGTLAKISKTKFREHVRNSDLYASVHGF